MINIIFFNLKNMEDSIKNYKLYKLTDTDNELLLKNYIQLEISYILKLNTTSLKDAFGTHFKGKLFEDIPNILLISEPRRIIYDNYIFDPRLNKIEYNSVKNLDNLKNYNIFMLLNYYPPKLAFNRKLNNIFLIQLRAEVTKIYIEIFHIKEISKLYNICDDIKKYIIQFLL